MSTETNNEKESIERHFSDKLTETAQIHPIFRTQSDRDKLSFVFDKEAVKDPIDEFQQLSR